MSIIIYIAGPVTGLKGLNAESFKMADRELTRQGFEVRNPSCLSEGWANYDHYIEVCLAMLKQCDGVVFLPGSEKSKGANIEKEHAAEWGIEGETDLIRGIMPKLNAELLRARRVAR